MRIVYQLRAISGLLVHVGQFDPTSNQSTALFDTSVQNLETLHGPLSVEMILKTESLSEARKEQRRLTVAAMQPDTVQTVYQSQPHKPRIFKRKSQAVSFGRPSSTQPLNAAGLSCLPKLKSPVVRYCAAQFVEVDAADSPNGHVEYDRTGGTLSPRQINKN